MSKKNKKLIKNKNKSKTIYLDPIEQYVLSIGGSLIQLEKDEKNIYELTLVNKDDID